MDTTTNPIETNGWDTVYAVPFAEVNKAIVKKASSPTSFTESETNDDGTTTFNGNFSHWELNKGGDGQLVMMKLPIPNATFATGVNNLSFTNGHAIIQLNLLWVNDPNNPIYQNLILNNDTNTVQVIDVVFTGVSAAVKGVMIQFMHNWLVKNITSFTNVFATININQAADTNSFAWLMPTAVSYAVKDVQNSDSIFGLLCMTENRVAPTSSQVPANALSSTANSALLISPERVVSEMFFPNIYSIFKEAKQSDFIIGNTKLYITNVNDLTFQDQTMEDGSSKTLTVKKNNFKLELQGTQIIMTLNKISFNYKAGIDVNFNHISYGVMEIANNGGFTIKVTGSNTDVGVETSTGVLVGEIIGSLAAAIIGAIIGGLIGGAVAGGEEAAEQVAAEIVENGVANAVEMQPVEGAAEIGPAAVADAAAQGPGRFSTFFAQNWAKLLGGFLGIAIGGVPVPVAMAVLKGKAEGETPDLVDFGANAISPVSWPGTTNNEFTIAGGSLNGALQLAINLKNT